MNKLLERIKIFGPYLLLILIIVLPWITKRGYLFFVDLSWGPNIALPEWTSNWFYFWFIIKIFSFFIPADILQKIFIVIVFGVVLLGGYKIGESLTKAKNILFLSSAFALFNPFVYDRFMYGQFGVVLSYGFFLIFFAYLIRFYFEFQKKQVIFAGIFAGLSILFSIHFIFFIFLICLFLGVLILIKYGGSKENLSKIINYFFLFLLFILVINFNWLYGAFLGDESLKEFIATKITEKDLWAFRTRGYSYSEVLKNVFFMSGFWGSEQFRYIPLKDIKPIWGWSFYLLFLIIVLGLVVSFKDKEKLRLTIALIFVFIISFILAIGIALPITSKINHWLFDNFFFYKGLREPQKWVAVIVAVYLFFLVSGLIELFKNEIFNKNKKLMIFVLILITELIILQAPLLIKGGAGQIKALQYPKDWHEVENFIFKDSNCQKKILFLPWHLYMNFKWIGNIVVNPAQNFFRCSVIYGENMEFGEIYTQSLKPEQQDIEAWLNSFGNTDLLSKNSLNIGYIVLAKEADWEKYLWIENDPNLDILKETENLKVYKVK